MEQSPTCPIPFRAVPRRAGRPAPPRPPPGPPRPSAARPRHASRLPPPRHADRQPQPGQPPTRGPPAAQPAELATRPRRRATPPAPSRSHRRPSPPAPKGPAPPPPPPPRQIACWAGRIDDLRATAGVARDQPDLTLYQAARGRHPGARRWPGRQARHLECSASAAGSAVPGLPGPLSLNS